MPRAVLVVAHPTVDAAMAFPGGRDRPDVAGAMQGVSLLNIARRGDAWIVVDGGFQNRRLTARTLCRLGADGGPSVGIIGVTGGCATPWGSVLLAEGGAAAWAGRLPGIDAAANGMLAELDPADPLAVPVKHAAPGRFGAVDAAAGLAADGRAVVWMVDGRAGGFLYRFLSDEVAGVRALDAGRLAAARIEGGSLRWLPLQAGDPLAAARNAGATPLDEPRAVAFDAASAGGCLSRCAAGRGRSSRSAPRPVTSPPRPASPRSSSKGVRPRRSRCAAARHRRPCRPGPGRRPRSASTATARCWSAPIVARGPARCPRRCIACR